MFFILKRSNFSMADIWKVFVVLIVVAAVGVILIMPAGNVGTNGFVLLAQDKESVDNYFENGKLKPAIVSQINSNIENVPEQLFDLFGGNKINIFVEYEDGSVRDYYAKTEKNRLKELSQGANSLADVEIKIKEKTINKLVESEKPFDSFLNAMNSGEIKYKGLNAEGTVKSATVGITTAVLGFVNGALNFFGNLLR